MRSGTSITGGYPTLLQGVNNLNDCSNWRGIEILEPHSQEDQPYLALINDFSRRLLLVDLGQCKELQIFIEIEYDEKGNHGLSGGSLSPNGNKLLFSYVTEAISTSPIYSINKLNIATGEIIELGVGVNPTWSPSGERIAYLKLDGIYVMASDGTRKNRVVEHISANSRYPAQFNYFTPIPRWSPDGEWLIYHKCDNNQVEILLEECGIYKVNVDTKAETMLVVGGVFPSWRNK